MTLTQDERAELIKHRVEKSRSLHNEALFLFDSGLYNTSVNRIYYAMYHAVSALALKDSFTTSKHLQLIGWFNREYVKTGRTDINSGKYLTRAFEMRSKSDYDDFVNYSQDEVKELLANMESFLETIDRLISSTYHG